MDPSFAVADEEGKSALLHIHTQGRSQPAPPVFSQRSQPRNVIYLRVLRRACDFAAGCRVCLALIYNTLTRSPFLHLSVVCSCKSTWMPSPCLCRLTFFPLKRLVPLRACAPVCAESQNIGNTPLNYQVQPHCQRRGAYRLAPADHKSLLCA